MVKLLICLFCALLIAAAMLELRQQRMNLGFESSQIHRDIERAQIRLWNQQLQIGIYTAPNAIDQTVRQHQLNLTRPAPAVTGTGATATPAAPADDSDAAE
jgi:hypothetical protein